MNKLSVAEYFYSIQGEGATMGKPAIFLRLAGCNLMCGGAGTEKDKKLHSGATWRCDTIEVWRKGKNYTIPELCKAMGLSFPLCGLLNNGVHLIITGGEPMLQTPGIVELINYLLKDVYKLTLEIETNGTFFPTALESYVGFWNVSPKLSTSGMKFEKRINIPVLKRFARLKESIFKFVVSNRHDIDEIISLKIQCNISTEKIWLMPACSDIDQLTDMSKLVAELCKKYQFNYSSRLQVSIWDKTTGV